MTTLFVITGLSVAVAAIMTVVAWRLAREEQRRSDARVETLAAEIQGGEGAPFRSHGIFVRRFVIGVLVVGTLATLAVVLTGSRPPASTATPPAAAPLELVALAHQRDGDRLAVRGVVRHPAGTADVERLDVVVFVFNRDGRFVTSTRAPIERGPLGFGVESSFAVTIAGADDVGRYRVSFRSDERIVAHVDRRDRTARLPRVQ